MGTVLNSVRPDLRAAYVDDTAVRHVNPRIVVCDEGVRIEDAQVRIDDQRPVGTWRHDLAAQPRSFERAAGDGHDRARTNLHGGLCFENDVHQELGLERIRSCASCWRGCGWLLRHRVQRRDGIESEAKGAGRRCGAQTRDEKCDGMWACRCPP